MKPLYKSKAPTKRRTIPLPIHTGLPDCKCMQCGLNRWCLENSEKPDKEVKDQ